MVKWHSVEGNNSSTHNYSSNHNNSSTGNNSIEYARYIVPNFASNTVLLDSKDGRVLVISPGADLLESFAKRFPDYDAPETAGEGITIVMPNAYHYLGVSVWKQRYPNARLLASAKARKRLIKLPIEGIHGCDTISDGLAGPVPESFWAVPPGHRGGDVWLVVKNSGGFVWITCDSFLHYPRVSNQPVARFVQKIMGAAPGLKLSRVIKYFLLNDRRAFKRWCLAFVKNQPPTVLLPSHGDVLVSEHLGEKLEALIRKRL